MKRNLLEKFIYSITQKPMHYVEVKNPPKTILEKLLRPQDARQLQYNRWSKRFKVYSGSYLPEKHCDLLKKGWKKKRVSDHKHHLYQRKSTHQTVRHDDECIKGENVIPSHWHWLAWWKPYFGPKTRKRFLRAKNSEKIYFNKYGELVTANNPEHHIQKRGN